MHHFGEKMGHEDAWRIEVELDGQDEDIVKCKNLH